MRGGWGAGGREQGNIWITPHHVDEEMRRDDRASTNVNSGNTWSVTRRIRCERYLEEYLLWKARLAIEWMDHGGINGQVKRQCNHVELNSSRNLARYTLVEKVQGIIVFGGALTCLLQSDIKLDE